LLKNHNTRFARFLDAKMSGTASPDMSKMTVYTCRGCKDNWMVVTEELGTGVIDGYDLSYWRMDNGAPSRCLNCIAVLGAIEKMRSLVVQQPWLATEGVAGAPKKEPWELVGIETSEAPVDSGVASHCSSNGDGRTRKESEKFRAEMAEGFAGMAGEGMSEEEIWEAKEGEKKEAEKTEAT
jgi:hypothetical protein